MSASKDGSVPVIWVIDDGPSNHRLVERSLPGEGYELVGYLDGDEALVELAAYLDSDNGEAWLPDIVFMDFFLGERNGGEITVEVRRLFAAAGRRGPWIIGHSSVMHCSRAIVELGGDVVMAKNPRQARSPDIVEAFPDAASLAPFAGRARGRV